MLCTHHNFAFDALQKQVALALQSNLFSSRMQQRAAAQLFVSSG
jgi:hypothetical protein